MIDAAILGIADRIVTWAVLPLAYFILALASRVLVIETTLRERSTQRVEDRDETKKALTELHTAIEKLRDTIERLATK